MAPRSDAPAPMPDPIMFPYPSVASTGNGVILDNNSRLAKDEVFPEKVCPLNPFDVTDDTTPFYKDDPTPYV